MTPERKARRSAQAKAKRDAMSEEERLALNAKRAARARELYSINPHARRAGNNRSLIKQRYGITIEQKDEILADQGGICAICETDTPPTSTGWYIDHCHSSRTIRGILCQHCNNMLGMAKDSASILRAAAEYLEKNR
jgi:hypothetical protein